MWIRLPYGVIIEALVARWTSMFARHWLAVTPYRRHDFFYLGDFSRSEEYTYFKAVETIRPLITVPLRAPFPIPFPPCSHSCGLAVFICERRRCNSNFAVLIFHIFLHLALLRTPRIGNIYVVSSIRSVCASNEESIDSAT